MCYLLVAHNHAKGKKDSSLPNPPTNSNSRAKVLTAKVIVESGSAAL